MATRTLTYDDLDESEGAQTVRISVGDAAVDIDLSPANLEKLNEALAPYFEHGREVVRRQGRGTSTAQMRKWLQEHGHKVGDKGRIPEDLQAIYREAHAGA
jgi:nucleoid-associated protein Lsr2